MKIPVEVCEQRDPKVLKGGPKGGQEGRGASPAARVGLSALLDRDLVKLTRAPNVF